MQLFYSTPTCYTKALIKLGPRLEIQTNDFFPYASSNHTYWTGYFTSKPVLKGLIRKSTALLQVIILKFLII